MKKLLGIVVLCLYLAACTPIEKDPLSLKGASIVEAKSFEVQNCKAIKETKAIHADCEHPTSPGGKTYSKSHSSSRE